MPPVRDLKQLDSANLMDLLSEQTSIYMKILRTGGTKDDLAACRKLIVAIQIEIGIRKDSAITSPDLVTDSTSQLPTNTAMQGLQDSPN